MTALVLLMLAGAPMPPDPVPALVIAPVSKTITLAWTVSPTPGCSNVLYWGDSQAALTNRFSVGTTNLCLVSVDDTRRYFQVRAVLNDMEAEPSNTIQYPPSKRQKIWVRRPDGSTIDVDTVTNATVNELKLWKLNITEENQYTP